MILIYIKCFTNNGCSNLAQLNFSTEPITEYYSEFCTTLLIVIRFYTRQVIFKNIVFSKQSYKK